jgi:hypothetical protein
LCCMHSYFPARHTMTPQQMYPTKSSRLRPFESAFKQDRSNFVSYFVFITIACSSLLPKTLIIQKKKKKNPFLHPSHFSYSLIALSHASVQFQELPGLPSQGAAYCLTLSCDHATKRWLDCHILLGHNFNQVQTKVTQRSIRTPNYRWQGLMEISENLAFMYGQIFKIFT